MAIELPPAECADSLLQKILIPTAVLALVYLLILSVGLVGTGFKWASGGQEGARELFAFATNPLMGLIVGILATALVQSSSTVTSVIVGLVAGGLDVHTAIPMIMGANIGTTVTNTLVSLGHITRPQEFRRAFAAATVHDMFNFLAVTIFLTLELLTSLLSDNGQGVLQSITEPIALTFAGSADVDVKSLNFIGNVTKPVIAILHDKSGTGAFDGMSPVGGGISMIVLALVMIFLSITLLGKTLKKNLTGRAERIFHAAVGRGPISGITSGTIVTILVQSSSTTTSLIIPMAGSGVMKLKQIFPFTLGANIGTTITALIASLSGGDYAEAALQIALVHLFFNVFATVLIYGIPPLRAIPLKGAEWLADIAVRKRTLAIVYVVVLYFLLPLGMLLVAQLLTTDKATTAATRSPARHGEIQSNLQPILQPFQDVQKGDQPC
ncbi:MAG: Na/Pi symporter [Gammaproteobacteria bacterium]|nr:Na/Pi symporter [Gammaproteobacteria bacterium]